MKREEIIQGAPLEIGDTVAVSASGGGDLVLAEGLVVADIFQVHRDDLEGFGGIPVPEGARGAGASFPERRRELMVVAQDRFYVK